MQRVLSWCLAVLTLAAGLTAVTAVTAASAADVPSQSGRYVPITPTRVVDTREGAGRPVGQNSTLDVVMPEVVPDTAVAVVLNLTATEPTAPGFLTVYPSDAERPLASSLNKRAGETRSNSVTVAMPESFGNRTVVVYNQAGTTHVVVDLVGYYDYFSGRSYHLVNPSRVWDTRANGGALAPGKRLTLYRLTPDNQTTVSAVALNITAVDPTGPGYLRAWDGVSKVPAVSTVNYERGRTTPNFAIVPVSQPDDNQYTFTVQVNVSAADVVVDVLGEYRSPVGGGLRFVATTPSRVMDTRLSIPPAAASPVGPGGTRDAVVPGDQVVAANLNVTAVEPTTSTFVSVYQAGANRPFVSTLNPVPGDIVANAAQTLLDDQGRFRVFNLAGNVDVVADLQGVFILQTDDKRAAREPEPAPVFTGRVS